MNTETETRTKYAAIVPRTRVRPEHLAALERRIPKGGTMSDALRIVLTEERDRQRVGT